MLRFVCRLMKSCEGPTAIEYGLICAVIVTVIIAGLTTVGTTLNVGYNSISNSVGS